MEQVSLTPALQELERVFERLNDDLYNGRLNKPLITIQGSERMKCLGWFWAGKWQSKEGSNTPEINLSAEYLSRPVLELVETLIHEMVHLDNWQRGIKDCSSNQYHNAKFKDGCERIGLQVEKTKKGWSLTSLGPELTKLLTERVKPSEEPFAVFRHGKATKEKKGSKLKKWSCDCTNVRVATEFNATCDSCRSKFELME